MSKKDYYDVLGINKSAEDGEIKKAFRNLAKKYHPDVSTEQNAESKFKEIQEAYAVLSDGEKRAQYDQFGHAGMNFGGGQGAGGFDGFGGFEDIFSSFFGGGNRRDPNAPTKGSDLSKRITITFEEAIFGIKKQIVMSMYEECSKCGGSGAYSKKDVTTCNHCNGKGKIYKNQQTLFGVTRVQINCPYCNGTGKKITKKCSTCYGEGQVKTTKTINFDIPAGIDEGQQMRLTGKGEMGTNGGPNGDLYIIISVKAHGVFERYNSDIILELPISFSQAALGAEIQVPTVYGDVMLKVPSGTQTETKFRLRGKGVPELSGRRVGDQHVIVKLITPECLDNAQKKLFKSLSETDEMTSKVWSKFKNMFKK